MKIMHVEAGRFLYGGGIQVVWLVEGLSKRGVQSVVVCPVGSEVAPAIKEIGDVRQIKMWGDLDIGLTRRIMRLARQEQPDLIHIHSRRGADTFGGIAAGLLGIPCVISRRVDNIEHRWSARLKYALYARIIVVSDAIKRVLGVTGITESKVRTVLDGVEASYYDVPSEKAWFEKEFCLPSDNITLGVIAQLIPRKGHRYLLDVLPALLEEHTNLHVLIFGKGPLEQDLRSQIKSPEFCGRVRLVGFREDIRQILPNLYAVVHPAEREGLGVALLQASACGVPVIAARAGGIPEIVLDGRNGITFDVGDKAALSSAIETLVADPSLREALGKEGRRLAETDFSVDAMVEGNLAVYRELVSS